MEKKTLKPISRPSKDMFHRPMKPLSKCVNVNITQKRSHPGRVLMFFLACALIFVLLLGTCSWYGEVYNYIYEITQEIGRELLPDKMLMNSDNGSDGGQDPPELSSGSSYTSDVDHEQDPEHEALQNRLEQQANELQHQLEEEARREEEIARLRAETEARGQAVLEARQALARGLGVQDQISIRGVLESHARQIDEQARPTGEPARVQELDIQARQIREIISLIDANVKKSLETV